jgi:uncharacterized protein YkwD
MSNSIRRDKKRSGELISVLSLAMLMAFSLVSSAGTPPYKAETPLVYASRPRIVIADLERQIHKLINNERKQYGLHPLAWDDTLARIARHHSSDMSTRKFFSHESPEGHDFSYRFRQEGYRCSIPVGSTRYLGAENIFQNYLFDSVIRVNGDVIYNWDSKEKIAETTVQGWMNSPGHRKNILTPYWSNEGIGVAVSPDGKIYITQNFC